MPLSWNEIKSRAAKFSKDWQHESSEDAEAKSFWDAFFTVFGVNRRGSKIAYEYPVKKPDGKTGFIDVFWRNKLIIEHKSKGKDKDLQKAYQQAKDYCLHLKDYDIPRYLLTCDFAQFKLYDLESNEQPIAEFNLTNLVHHVELFGFIAGYETKAILSEDPVNQKAAEQMAALHDQLKAIGYDGHALEVYLVRLVFCLFAEDTGIFEVSQFRDFIEQRTHEDGSDLASQLNHLFQILNTPKDKRLKNLDQQLAAFEYINGKLFAEPLGVASFDSTMRLRLLQASALNWGQISPAIFGALFQGVMDEKQRRNLGAHYTSERNILRVIEPLFLDELKTEFDTARTLQRGKKERLQALHTKIANLTFLDPACGCGNFLIITYRELRQLELNILQELYLKEQTQLITDVDLLLKVQVDHFGGIEIEEFAAQIAQVALWLVDHQLNMQVSALLGSYYARLPLRKHGAIIHANALRYDWREVFGKVPDYILGNPPFLGYTQQNKAQKEDMALITQGIKGSGVLDFVTAGYIKATDFIQNTSTKVAFVSTNSITQGEQVGILWSYLLSKGIKIHFAHRTFQWSNEARGIAAVHCVIVGFGLETPKSYRLFEYEDIKKDGVEISAQNINPYLVDAPSVFIEKRRKPICQVVEMTKGSQPTDGGNLLFSDHEKIAFIEQEPLAEKYIRPFLGSEEFINNIKRWCLWLENAEPSDLRKMPKVQERLKAVKEMRLASTKEATQKWANFPSQFTENRQPKSDYLVVPSVSSENRQYIPIGYLHQKVIASNLVFS
ncbi:MAG: class I SAM-dependent DNA methyltransferase, partial [Moraxellaceae bacterium]|nr:class I SAM-dependent DNA methyltransferase [Moraxellaceae bacterium]